MGSNKQDVWTQQMQQQYENVRADIVNSFNNSMNVINTRWVAEALGYNGAKQEIADAKQSIFTLTNRLAIESDKLNDYLKRINETSGPKLIEHISERELMLRRLEEENEKVENTKELRQEQSESLYNKYEGNYHSQTYGYAPWEVSSSRWFSWSPLSSYMNLNPSLRSGILFLGFLLGFLAIIALGAKVALMYAYPTTTTFVPTQRFGTGTGFTAPTQRFGLGSTGVKAPQRF